MSYFIRGVITIWKIFWVIIHFLFKICFYAIIL
jgi:hypothetical protein